MSKNNFSNVLIIFTRGTKRLIRSCRQNYGMSSLRYKPSQKISLQHSNSNILDHQTKNHSCETKLGQNVSSGHYGFDAWTACLQQILVTLETHSTVKMDWIGVIKPDMVKNEKWCHYIFGVKFLRKHVLFSNFLKKEKEGSIFSESNFFWEGEAFLVWK